MSYVLSFAARWRADTIWSRVLEEMRRQEEEVPVQHRDEDEQPA